MPATAKRGFRLPWMRDDAGSEAVGTQLLDGRPGDAPSPDADPATEPEAEALDDLGSGPFGIAPPPPPREVPAMDDPGEVLDLEQRTSPEPNRDDGTDGEPGGDVPKWLRQGPSSSSDGAPATGPDHADARPGINVSPSIEPTPPNGSVPHEAAPASAWPEADFAARAVARPQSDDSATADPGTMPSVTEAPRPDGEALQLDAEPIAGDAAPAPDHAEPTSAPEGSAASTTPDGTEPPELAAPAGAPSGRRTGPARIAASAATVQPATTQPAHERRDNPLLTGLVRAMRDSARTTREETTARLRVEAEARVAAIRARSAADAVALRTQAAGDVAGIREWSKAEMVRIRLETAERIEARRGQLATDSHALSSLTSRLVGEIEAAVASFETEMKRFFKALLAEEDPAQLATLAERMPEPPVLESLPEAVAVGIDHVSSGARSRANRAAAKPAKRTKRATRPPTSKSADRARSSAVRSSRRPSTAVPVADDDPVAGGSPTIEAGALDPEAAALAEAEALAGLDLSAVTGGDWPISGVTPSSNGATRHEATGDDAEPGPTDDEFMIESQTRLIVVGLGDAGVAAFEGALRDVSGVGSVNVSPGAEGEVVFSVTHGTDTDLRAAVPGLGGFRAHVTADEGAILSVAAHDPR